MKINYLFFGMRRSGLHCIIHDIKKYTNIGEFHDDTNEKKYKKLIKKNKDYNEMFLFEDKLFNVDTYKIKTYKIIIIRDIFSNIVSRIKTSKNIQETNLTEKQKKNLFNCLKIDKSYFNLYFEYLNNKDHIIILYSKFINDNVYRKNIFLKLGITCKLNKFNKNILISSKSFKRNEKRTDIFINKNIINSIKENIKIQEKIKEYFNYDLLEKIYHQNELINS